MDKTKIVLNQVLFKIVQSHYKEITKKCMIKFVRTQIKHEIFLQLNYTTFNS